MSDKPASSDDHAAYSKRSMARDQIAVIVDPGPVVLQVDEGLDLDPAIGDERLATTD